MDTYMVKFSNYYKSYAFKSNLPLKEGKFYNIEASGTKYSTPVYIDGKTDETFPGITLKEITHAQEVVNET